MYTLKLNTTIGQTYVESLPLDFEIISHNNSYHVNKNWFAHRSGYFKNFLSEFQNNFIELDDTHVKYFVDLVNEKQVRCDSLHVVLDLLLMLKKYLVEVNVIGCLHSLNIDDFDVFMKYIPRLCDNNISDQMIDVIAQKLKYNMDLSKYDQVLVTRINASKFRRNYGHGFIKQVVLKLEEISRVEQDKPLRKFYFEHYKNHTYSHIVLNTVYECHSVAEAVLQFRDHLLYLTTYVPNHKLKYYVGMIIQPRYPDPYSDEPDAGVGAIIAQPHDVFQEILSNFSISSLNDKTYRENIICSLIGYNDFYACELKSDYTS